MNYFVLEMDPAATVIALFQEDVPGHDLKWFFGQPLNTTINPPRNIRVAIDDDFDLDEYEDANSAPPSHEDDEHTGIPDLFDTMRAPVVSEQFKNTLERIGADNVELFTAKIEGASERAHTNHYALNIIGRIAAIDESRSVLSTNSDQIVRIQHLTLQSRLLQEFKIFRLHEYPEIIIVTEDVASALKPLSGVLLSPANGWNDDHRF